MEVLLKIFLLLILSHLLRSVVRIDPKNIFSMGFSKYICITVIGCFVPTIGISAQQIQRQVAISAYIYNFAKNVQWQNEETIKEFHFLIIGQDENIIHEMTALANAKTLRNKPIRVSSSKTLKDIDNVQLIFATKENEENLVKIFDQIEGKNILLVSDGYQDKQLIMINFFDTEEGTLLFEINKINIINQHLSIMPDMILLGGTTVDVAELYREGQQSLRSLQKHIENLENNLIQLENIITDKTKEIEVNKDSLKRQTLKIQEQQKILDAQSQLLRQREKELEIQIQKIQEQQKIFNLQSQNIIKQTIELKKGNEILQNQEREITRQKSEILSQSHILKEQGLTIHRQRNLMYLLGIIIILVAILVMTIYYGYKNKQKLNKELENRVTERTNDLNVLNEQLRIELTERKKAEEAISQERILLRTLIDNLPDAIYVKDTEGRKLIANFADLQIMNRTSEAEIIGKTDLEIFDAETGAHGHAEDMSVLQTGQPLLEHEDCYIDVEGKQHWRLISKIPLCDEQKQIIGLVGYGHDFTERKKAEEAFMESYKFNNSLLQTIPFGMDIVDEEGNVLFQNENFRKISGPGTIGKKCWELYRDDKKQCTDCPLLRGVKIGLTETYESHGILGGRIFDISYTGMMFKDKKAILEIFIDITERKQAEETLKNSEERMKILFDCAPDAYYLNDLKGKFIDGNIEAEKLLGYKKDKLIGKSFLKLKLLSPSQLPRVAKLLVNNLLGKGTGPDEFVLNRKDGSKVNVEIITHPVKIHGKTMVLGIARDITERKKTEEEKAKLMYDMGERIKELKCITTISNAIRTREMLEEIFQEAVNSIPTGWQYPEITRGKISFNNKEFVSEPFTETEWNQKSDMVINGKKVGSVEVYYLEDRPMLDEGPFFKEEGTLIDNISNMLCEAIEMNQAKQEIQNINKELEQRVILRTSELTEVTERLELATRAGLIGVWDWNIKENVLKWDDLMFALYGINPDEYEADYETWIKSLYPEDKKRSEMEIQEALQGSKDYNTEFRVVWPDGSIHNIYAIGTVKRDNSGEATRIIGVNWDITARKKLEKEVIEAKEAAESVIETSPIPLAIIELQSARFIKMNKAFIDFMEADTIESYNPEKLYVNFIVDRERLLASIKQNGNVQNMELQIRRLGTDESAWVLFSMFPMIYLGKNCQIASFIDINQRKKIEFELSEAKEIAEAATRAKSEFLANMSHEIRTPMNAVIGYADLLSPLVTDDMQRSYLNSITKSGKNLMILINDILDLAKIEAHKLELQFEYIDAFNFFSELGNIFSFKIEEKSLEFILDVASSTPKGLCVDETRLRQILVNLIGNAIKFTEKGYVKIHVWTENPQILEYTADKVEEFIDLSIVVEDTGVGISKENQEMIFESFQQQDGQRTKKYGGTGLGLTITKKLAELMNGTITVESELNKGSRFKVMIPDVPYVRDFEGIDKQLFIDTRRVVFEPATILVVDDVEHNRKYLSDALKETDLRIIEAENGEIGFRMAKESNPDLIIADIRMPVMDGFELLSLLKRNKKLKHIPVVAYSASVMKSKKEEIIISDFAGLITKPVQVSEIYIELMNHLPHHILEDEKEKEALLPDKETHDPGLKDLPGLIDKLEKEVKNKWDAFARKQPINEVREFGEILMALGEKHHSVMVKDYGNELLRAANTFNIGEILNLLKRYPKIIEKLKNNNNQHAEKEKNG